jgi:hypothetical protein
MSLSLAASCSFALLSSLAVPPQQPNDAGKPTWTRERALAALRSDSAAEQFVAAQQLEYHGLAVLADLRKLRDDATDPALRSSSSCSRAARSSATSCGRGGTARRSR